MTYYCLISLCFFRNRLIESESMSSAAIRRAQNISRMAMSPGSPDDTAAHLIELAKLDVKKGIKKIKKVQYSFVDSRFILMLPCS